MKKIFGSLLILSITFFLFGCQSAQKGMIGKVTPEKTTAIAPGGEGSYVFRASGYGRNRMVSRQGAIRQAVEDAMFTNVPKAFGDKVMLLALVPDTRIRTAKAQYFEDFLSPHGDYKKYVDVSDRRIKTTSFRKNGVQVICTMSVTVNRNALERRLREDGIIK